MVYNEQIKKEINLQSLLNKLGKTNKYTVNNPVTYATKDAKKARTILDRLLQTGDVNEVVSISEVLYQVNEI